MRQKRAEERETIAAEVRAPDPSHVLCHQLPQATLLLSFMQALLCDCALCAAEGQWQSVVLEPIPPQCVLHQQGDLLWLEVGPWCLEHNIDNALIRAGVCRRQNCSRRIRG